VGAPRKIIKGGKYQQRELESEESLLFETFSSNTDISKLEAEEKAAHLNKDSARIKKEEKTRKATHVKRRSSTDPAKKGASEASRASTIESTKSHQVILKSHEGSVG